MTDPKTVQLEDPITFKGREIAEITIKPPRGRDIQALRARKGKDDMEETFYLLSLLTGEEPQLFPELTLMDLDKLQEEALVFFPTAYQRMLSSAS